MFNVNMIAPCGLDCSICKLALAETNPCAGCRGPNDNKPEFCSSGCGVICVHTGICSGCGWQYTGSMNQ